MLKFNGVKEYKLEEGMIVFKDKKTRKIKRFAPCNVEIDNE